MSRGGVAPVTAPLPAQIATPAPRTTPTRKSRSGGLRLTKIGLGFAVLAVVLALAASNTGNNGLYLVLAAMSAMLAVSQVAAAANLRRLRTALEVPDEIYVNRPTYLRLEVENRSRLLPSFLLLCRLVSTGAGRESPIAASLIGMLPRGARHRGDLELLARRRGRWVLDSVEISSLFPFGFFHKVRRHPQTRELLVYPEIFAPPARQPTRTGRAGDESARRRGWGHELIGLRVFRHGDDPRAIHWKQTARTGELIVKEREAEESRRLSIVFDNAVPGRLSATEAGRARFERLVSEAATAAHDTLSRGREVELVTRQHFVPFASGRRQRRRVLETLALIEPVPRPAGLPALMASSSQVPHLRLTMDARDRSGAASEVASEAAS